MCRKPQKQLSESSHLNVLLCFKLVRLILIHTTPVVEMPLILVSVAFGSKTFWGYGDRGFSHRVRRLKSTRYHIRVIVTLTICWLFCGRSYC